ncbi:class I SAM-dependent methyltransferase [Acidiphilium sp. PA]|uniref:class I SAM-dependent methyltransferase n=1 Tax=Acidiphilium sp. PA TaxID=2871705 RepID=UPI002244704B|nr:class I SAM-dependent methyltransferase [Acidiphilium sp. PA]MCW8306502.1 class I SAM-dependent methyltransferase [Acidiphilium sp. PA]
MAEPRTEHWDAAYRRTAPDRLSWHEASPAVSLAMIDACSLPPRASAVDVGGGTAQLAPALVERGFGAVTVVDLSRQALDAAQAALGAAAARIDFVCADITHWIPGERFDLWHDRAVFHFLTDPHDRDRYIALATESVRPGGFLILATFAPEGPERCSGLAVQRYSADDLAARYAPAFVLLDHKTHTHVTPAGVSQVFTYVRLQRHASD